MRTTAILLLSLTTSALLMSACTKKSDTKYASSAPQAAQFVKFANLTEGQKVPQKFTAQFSVTGMEVKPAGQLIDNTGHFHVVISGGPVPKGEMVPFDDKHLHYGQGQTEAELELTPGPYKLTLQFADGAHISYGPAMAQSLNIIVE